MITAKQTAAIATRVFMDDLRLRSGFRELIASIGDWSDIEHAMEAKVERALEPHLTAPVPQQTSFEQLD